MPDWSTVVSGIAEATGEELASFDVRPAGGGCINEAAVLARPTRRYFVKYNDPARLGMFAAEAAGLEALAATRAVRVPAAVCWGAADDMAFLVLEYLALSPAGAQAQAALGTRLANLHRVTEARYGWYRDNTIGTTHQPNAFADSWVTFLRDRRLGFQLELAARGGYRSLHARGEKLLAHLGAFFTDHTPEASLLHGDLWSGNIAETAPGEPVMFDPAPYFGDREADVAMTELFGGFSAGFYRSYQEAWPLAPGYAVRKTLYNLYHLLNHLNLFGRGYLAQTERTIARLLAEVG